MTDTTPPEQPLASQPILGASVDDILNTVALLGHDLNSPIAIVISALESIISMYEDDEVMALLMPLLRGTLVAAKRERNMIFDLLDLARLETHNFELVRLPTDLVSLLRESLEAESYPLGVKTLKLEMNLPQTPLLADIDVDLFRRVFSALVDNSIKFTVRNDSLKVSAQRDGETIKMTFTDNGRPIAPDFEDDILKRAPHWEKRLAGSRTSVAMGLPFAYAVLRAHGGDFRGKSDPAAGMTTFTLVVPAYQPA